MKVESNGRTKRKVLGRGLSALIPDTPSGARTDDYFLCPIEQIRPSADQPRRHFDEATLAELADSVRQHGMMQPLVVRPDGQQPGHYVLIAGERRWRAAQRAALHRVPVVIRQASEVE